MTISEAKQRAAARDFAKFWEGKGYEKGQSQSFWLSLLRDVFGVSEPEKFITFEDQVKLDSTTGFIDGYIAETKVMIEQKGSGKDLNIVRRRLTSKQGKFFYEQGKLDRQQGKLDRQQGKLDRQQGKLDTRG